MLGRPVAWPQHQRFARALLGLLHAAVDARQPRVADQLLEVLLQRVDLLEQLLGLLLALRQGRGLQVRLDAQQFAHQLFDLFIFAAAGGHARRLKQGVCARQRGLLPALHRAPPQPFHQGAAELRASQILGRIQNDDRLRVIALAEGAVGLIVERADAQDRRSRIADAGGAQLVFFDRALGSLVQQQAFDANHRDIGRRGFFPAPDLFALNTADRALVGADRGIQQLRVEVIGAIAGLLVGLVGQLARDPQQLLAHGRQQLVELRLQLLAIRADLDAGVDQLAQLDQLDLIALNLARGGQLAELGAKLLIGVQRLLQALFKAGALGRVDVAEAQDALVETDRLLEVGVGRSRQVALGLALQLMHSLLNCVVASWRRINRRRAVQFVVKQQVYVVHRNDSSWNAVLFFILYFVFSLCERKTKYR